MCQDYFGKVNSPKCKLISQKDRWHTPHFVAKLSLTCKRGYPILASNESKFLSNIKIDDLRIMANMLIYLMANNL